ncbi:MAG TPA: DUF4337 domain-containing protein [Acidobacteriota bacterium]|jgi:hypothetical protein|nr:DUF4337 domain-containing protein [Acidobacteriota bacterium]
MEEAEIGEVGIDKVGERAAEGVKEGTSQASWLRWLALSTALFAVLAAIASLQSGRLANEALLRMNEATLKQAQASDQWSYYQAKGIKMTSRQVEMDLLVSTRDSANLISEVRDEATRYKSEQEEIRKEAEKLEREQKGLQEKSTVNLEHHHLFAYVVTLLQVSIGLSAVAAIVERRSIWYLALLAGSGGIVLLAHAFLQLH